MFWWFLAAQAVSFWLSLAIVESSSIHTGLATLYNSGFAGHTCKLLRFYGTYIC
jgi:hypothetical protein